MKHYRIEGAFLRPTTYIDTLHADCFYTPGEVRKAIEASGVVPVIEGEPRYGEIDGYQDCHVLGLYLADGDLDDYDELMAFCREEQ